MIYLVQMKETLNNLDGNKEASMTVKLLDAICYCMGPLDEQANNNMIGDESYSEDRAKLKLVYSWIRKERSKLNKAN